MVTKSGLLRYARNDVLPKNQLYSVIARAIARSNPENKKIKTVVL